MSFLKSLAIAILAATTCLTTLAKAPDGPIHNLKIGHQIHIEGTSRAHLQGFTTDGTYIYWCMTTSIIKTDLEGNVIKKQKCPNHGGAPCFVNGKIYVPVCRSGFNKRLEGKPSNNYILVYDTELNQVEKHDVHELEFGAGGIAAHDGKFYIVGGRPLDMPGVEVCEYTADFKPVKKYHVPVEAHHMGIQVISFDGEKWWLGCYGKPRTVVTDKNFENHKGLRVNTSVGLIHLKDGKCLLAKSGRDKETKLYSCHAVVVEKEKFK